MGRMISCSAATARDIFRASVSILLKLSSAKEIYWVI